MPRSASPVGLARRGVITAVQREPFYSVYGWTQSLKHFGNDATNHYNALQLEFQTNFSKGAVLQATYTHASAFDYNNDYYRYNRSIAYGPNSTVRNDSFTLSYVYDLPFGREKDTWPMLLGQ
jgi:hypothetical protein